MIKPSEPQTIRRRSLPILNPLQTVLSTSPSRAPETTFFPWLAPRKVWRPDHTHKAVAARQREREHGGRAAHPWRIAGHRKVLGKIIAREGSRPLQTVATPVDNSVAFPIASKLPLHCTRQHCFSFLVPISLPHETSVICAGVSPPFPFSLDRTVTRPSSARSSQPCRR